MKFTKLLYMRIKILWCICWGILALSGCRDEFDDHYHKVGDDSIGKSVTQVLEDRGEFSLFLGMIRRADLERTLTQSGLYTCFAPRDKDVQEWLDKNGWTVETMPLRVANLFVNYHFIKGMKYYYDFEKKYQDATDWEDTPEMYTQNLMWSTRAAGNLYPAKSLRVFTESYLSARAEDYKKMRLVEPGDFMVEDVAVSSAERDIPTANGVIHVLDAPLMLTPRLDEALNGDPELSVIMKWFNRFANTELLQNDKGEVDTVENRFYDISLQKGGKVLDIGNEATGYTVLMPVDEAMKNYFAKYLNAEQWTEMDSVPDEFVVPFLKSLVSYTFNRTWGLSDIDRNSPYFSCVNGAILPLKNNISSMYCGALVASNGLVYKLNQVPEIPLMSSVELGFYLNRKRFRKTWGMMVERGKIPMENFGTNQTYQHVPKLVLMQPDDAEVWANEGLNKFEDEYQDTLAWRMNAGFLTGKLNEGELEHRFYQGPRGALLCERQDGEWTFSDFKGNVIRLQSQSPLYSTDGGSAIFCVEDIPEQLAFNDTTELIYRKYIERNGELNNFRRLCEKADMQKLLDSKSNTFYTVFAPNDEALSYDKVEALEEKDAKDLVRKCIVEGRRIYTDGFTQGDVLTLGKLSLKLSGSWENFHLEAQYDRAGVVAGKCNLQGSNGVLHIIDHLLEK